MVLYPTAGLLIAEATSFLIQDFGVLPVFSDTPAALVKHSQIRASLSHCSIAGFCPEPGGLGVVYRNNFAATVDVAQIGTSERLTAGASFQHEAYGLRWILGTAAPVEKKDG